MIIRALREEERHAYNAVVEHPLQSWEWGVFRKRTGVVTDRVGFFDNGKLVKGVQVTFHTIPKLNKTIGYLPKSYMPDEEQLSVLKQLAEKHDAVAIKIEPNIAQPVSSPSGHDAIQKFLLDNGAVPGRPLFTKYTFQIDLTRPEKELFANLESKTRYNVRLAVKKGVQIFENTSEQGMEEYIKILEETTNRQGFYAHNPDYFRTMWQSLGNSGMIRIFEAHYEDTILASWVMFIFNDTLYYPYGASRSVHREVMASNLLMWEMMRFGKSQGCTLFDLWGSLGPEPDKKHPWYGFHKFKKGYNGQLMEFIGTYDIVTNPLYYKIFRIGDFIRWKVLRLKAKLGR